MSTSRSAPIRRLAAAVLAAILMISGTLVLASAARAGDAHDTGPVLPTQDPFYAYDGSLAGIAPGTVLRTRTVDFDVSNLTVPISTTQILYRTTSELGAPIADVTTVMRPLAGLSGRIISWQTAYDGLASNCEPSFAFRGGTPTEATNPEEQDLMVPLLAAGDIVVTSDYEGEDNAFVAGHQEGYATLDSIRAAESFLGLGASTPVGMVGYSGGSIATAWASELAPRYAPGLNLVGAAIGAVPVDLAHNLAYISSPTADPGADGNANWSGAIPAALVGIARGLHVDLSKYLNAYGMSVVEHVGTTCLQSDLNAYPGLTLTKLLKPQYANYLEVPVLVNAFNTLNLGHGGAPTIPILLGVGNKDGTGDGVMVAGDVEGLAHEYCGDGLPVQFSVYQGDDHGEGAVSFLPTALQFLEERLSGAPATNGCSQIGTGNSLALLPVPAASSAAARHVHIQFRGVRSGAAVVWVRAFRSSIDGVRVRLLSVAGRQLAASRSFDARRDRLVKLLLRLKGGSLRPGSYRAVVTVAGSTVASERVVLRRSSGRHRAR